METTTTFSPPAKDRSAELPTFQVRKRAACSLVKQQLLGDRHRPFEVQQTAMAKALRANFRDSEKEVSKETWASWWSGRREMKAGSLAMLDRASGQPEGFIASLVTGSPYQPLSCLHLHFEALDAAGYFGRKSDETWEQERRDRALAVLDVLHQKWRPTASRYVRHAFPKSCLQVEYEALATDEEREAYWAETGDMKAYFEMRLNDPDPLSDATFDAYDPQSPVCMPRFLMAVGHDLDFLSEDKIEAWAWDLATAALALFGLLHASRYDGSLGAQREHMWLWSQMFALFWMPPENHTPVSDHEFMLYFVELRHTAEYVEVLDIFCRARSSYQARLNELALVPADVRAIFNKSIAMRPIVYSASRPAMPAS